MFIILHCRALFVTLLVILFGIPFGAYFSFVQPSLAHPVAMLVCLHLVSSYLYSSLQSPCVADIELRIKLINILYQKAALLSLLSTSISPEHEPLPPNRVVNLQHYKLLNTARNAAEPGTARFLVETFNIIVLGGWITRHAIIYAYTFTPNPRPIILKGIIF